jgi:chromate transporter
LLKSKLKDCLTLYLLFFKIGAVTFGGGYAMLPFLNHELVEKKQWYTKEKMMDYFAMAQSLPGIIGVNVATLCGSDRAGFVGSLCAALGLITPSIAIISVIAAFIDNFTGIPAVQRVMRGLNVAVAALLTQSVVKMVKPALIDKLTAGMAIVAFVVVAVFGVSSVLVLLVAVAISLIVKRREWRKPAKQK